MKDLTIIAAEDQSAVEWLSSLPIWVQFLIGLGLLLLAVVLKKADEKYDGGQDEEDSGTGFLGIGAVLIGIFGLIALWVAVF